MLNHVVLPDSDQGKYNLILFFLLLLTAVYQCLRRWTNSKPIKVQSLAFAVIISLLWKLSAYAWWSVPLDATGDGICRWQELLTWEKHHLKTSYYYQSSQWLTSIYGRMWDSIWQTSIYGWRRNRIHPRIYIWRTWNWDYTTIVSCSICNAELNSVWHNDFYTMGNSIHRVLLS